MQAFTMSLGIDIQCTLLLALIVLMASCLWDQEGCEMKVPEMTLILVAWIFKSIINLKEKNKLNFVFVNDSRV